MGAGSAFRACRRGLPDTGWLASMERDGKRKHVPGGQRLGSLPRSPFGFSASSSVLPPCFIRAMFMVSFFIDRWISDKTPDASI
jgi:hypothetical protein